MGSINTSNKKYFRGSLDDFQTRFNKLSSANKEKFNDALTFIGDPDKGISLMVMIPDSTGKKIPTYFRSLGSGVNLTVQATSWSGSINTKILEKKASSDDGDIIVDITQDLLDEFYLSKSDASSTYLSKSDASSTYREKSVASTELGEAFNKTMNETRARYNYNDLPSFIEQDITSIIPDRYISVFNPYVSPVMLSSRSYPNIQYSEISYIPRLYVRGSRSAEHIDKSPKMYIHDTTTKYQMGNLSHYTVNGEYVFDCDEVGVFTTESKLIKLVLSGLGSSSGTVDLSDYLSKSDASSTYLSKSDASSTYLSKSDASSTYLSKSDASSTYLSKSDAKDPNILGNIIENIQTISSLSAGSIFDAISSGYTEKFVILNTSSESTYNNQHPIYYVCNPKITEDDTNKNPNVICFPNLYTYANEYASKVIEPNGSTKIYLNYKYFDSLGLNLDEVKKILGQNVIAADSTSDNDNHIYFTTEYTLIYILFKIYEVLKSQGILDKES